MRAPAAPRRAPALSSPARKNRPTHRQSRAAHRKHWTCKDRGVRCKDRTIASLSVGAWRRVIFLSLLFALPAATHAQYLRDAEQFFFESANKERIALHLQPLKWDAALAKAARRHATLMAEQKQLEHRLPDEPALDERAAQTGARFSQIGENIAIGPLASTIHTGWMHSPGHRANILDVHFTALGVGVVEDDGELYAVEDFSLAVASLGIEEQERKVAGLLSAMGVEVTGDHDLARKSCGDELIPTGHTAMLVLYYEAPDISKLPQRVEQKIRDGKYRIASVGACQPKESGVGIARFRVTLLLSGAPAKKPK